MEVEKAEYFYKLIQLVVDLGTEVLLKFFKSQISGQTIESFLKSKQREIQKLKKYFTDMQLNILKASNPDESKFDISLLFSLLRNLTNIQEPNLGWSVLYPPSSDMSPGALLMRLKHVRNEAIAHKSKAALTLSEFERYWKEAADTLGALAGEISPEEKRAVEQKVEEAKTKSLGGDVNLKLDQLLKWNFEEKFSELASKLDNMHEKIDKHGNMSEEIGSMKSSIQLVQDQLKQLGIQDNSTEATSSLVQARQTMSDGDGRQKSEVTDIKDQIVQMQQQMSQFMKNMESMFAAQPRMVEEPPEDPITNENALTADQILDYSRELGSDWEIFAIYLGYRQVQIEVLKDTYMRQIETLLQVMIDKWHNVVARCDENPKWLLAAAFSGIHDNYTAGKILGNRALVPEVKDLKPKKETAEKIKKISFARKPQVMVNFGAPNSINNFPGSDFNNYGTILTTGPYTHSFPTHPCYYPAMPYNIGHGGSYGPNHPQALMGHGGAYGPNHPQALMGHGGAYGPNHPQALMGHGGAYGPNHPQAMIGHGGAHGPNAPQAMIGHAGAYGTHTNPQTRPNDTGNICRGEFDTVDGTPSNLYKKTDDSTLPHHTVNILGLYMESVGCLLWNGTKGTVFRAGDRYVITALHVVTPIKHEMYTQRIPLGVGHTIPCVFVNFNENPETPPKTLYTLNPPCFMDTDLDIAILEISNPDDSLPRPLPLSRSEGPISYVSCLGYGHPGSNLKHLDPKCTVLPVNSEKVMNSINMVVAQEHVIREALKQNGKIPDLVNMAFTGYDDPSRFLIDCFFEHGGSGGPAVDHNGHSSPQIVGIYTKGFPSFFFDLPVQLQCRYRAEFRFEMCTRTSSLYSVLLSYKEALASSIFGPP